MRAVLKEKGPGRGWWGPPKGTHGAGSAKSIKAELHNRATDEQIVRWRQEISTWEGNRGGMASTALWAIENERVAAFSIESEGELKAIAALSIPRSRVTFFGVTPPSTRITGLWYAATKERGYGLQMMAGIAQEVVENDWQLSFGATNASIGFYRAIGLNPTRAGSKDFFYDTPELETWLKSL